MSINAISAARLYSNAQMATRPGPSGATGEGFAGYAQDLISTVREGEDTARKAMMGQASLPDLAQAMARSALAVETAVTVRNKVVEAYQEILRMPV